MTDTRNARSAEVKAATRGLINEHTRTNSINFISSNHSNTFMDTGENGMSDIKRYDPGTDFCTDMDQIKDGDYVLYADHIEAVVLKDARIDWVVKDNAKKAIEIATMRDLLIKCSNRLKAVSANAYDYESFSLHSEIETALETDK